MIWRREAYYRRGEEEQEKGEGVLVLKKEEREEREEWDPITWNEKSISMLCVKSFVADLALCLNRKRETARDERREERRVDD